MWLFPSGWWWIARLFSSMLPYSTLQRGMSSKYPQILYRFGIHYTITNYLAIFTSDIASDKLCIHCNTNNYLAILHLKGFVQSVCFTLYNLAILRLNRHVCTFVLDYIQSSSVDVFVLHCITLYYTVFVLHCITNTYSQNHIQPMQGNESVLLHNYSWRTRVHQDIIYPCTAVTLLQLVHQINAQFQNTFFFLLTKTLAKNCMSNTISQNLYFPPAKMASISCPFVCCYMTWSSGWIW